MSYNQGYEFAGDTGFLSDIMTGVWGYIAGALTGGTAEIPAALMSYAIASHNGDVQDAIHYIQSGNIIVTSVEQSDLSGNTYISHKFETADGFNLGTISY